MQLQTKTWTSRLPITIPKYLSTKIGKYLPINFVMFPRGMSVQKIGIRFVDRAPINEFK